MFQFCTFRFKVCVCMCVLVYVIYEDTNLYNDMCITLVLQLKRGL